MTRGERGREEGRGSYRQLTRCLTGPGRLDYWNVL